MSNFDIITPDLPESVADATVVTWHKNVGDAVKCDEVLVEIETDKIVLEIPALSDGVLETILQPEGSTVVSKQLLGKVSASAGIGEVTKSTVQNVEKTPADRHSANLNTDASSDVLSPAVRRLLAEHELNADEIKGTGVGGRITREDIALVVKQKVQQTETAQASQSIATGLKIDHRNEKRVPMTRLRKRIAERLLEAKNTTAMLTTFNEVDMQPIMNLRKRYAEKFEKQHGARLGFMSFYIKAVVEALKRYP